MSGSPQSPPGDPFEEGPRRAGQAPEDALRRCDRPGCPAEGLHRAPRSRDALNSYFWFCLDHVREYNLAWDYFRGMDEEAIEQSRRRDAVWQRPSWPLNGGKANGYRSRPLHDGFGFFAEETAEQQCQAGRFPPNSRQAKALRILDLGPNADLAEVKARYKALVKELHPDITGGDGRAEDRLKIINLAYSDLKAAFE
ncbi:MAG: J domain-containing protein [Kiloniellaceae bacterium]